jgi:hypothetical protein
VVGGELLRDSLRIARDLQDVIGESNVLEAMGTAYVRGGRGGGGGEGEGEGEGGDAAEAVSMLHTCVELRERVGFTTGAQRVHMLLHALQHRGGG